MEIVANSHSGGVRADSIRDMLHCHQLRCHALDGG